VAVSPELDLVVSGAADGTLLLHSLSSGAYVRSFCLPHGVPPALLCIAPKPGLLLAHSHVDLALHLFNLNCRHLASADTHERLAALCPTPDGRLLLAAGTSGLVTLRWLHSLQVVLRYDSGRGPVTALAVSPEGCFLAGTAEGSVVLFAPDPRRRITTRFNLAA
jgi:WD40 repeat protein